MAGKKSKNRQTKQQTDAWQARRTRTLQIVIVGFSIILILSMILSLASK
jgi:hypothetical protein